MSERFNSVPTVKSERITKLVEDLFKKLPEIEASRAVLLTESYKQTENEPIELRRAYAFEHILDNIPIIIRDEELIVGSQTLAPRGCQTYPEFSYEWLEAEFDTVEHREADPFYISEETRSKLRAVHPYWKDKTSSDLALSYMAPEAVKAIGHNVFTPGNYFYNGVGHLTVHYDKVLAKGFKGIIAEIDEKLSALKKGDMYYARKHTLLRAMRISCEAVIRYAGRYSTLAGQMAAKEADPRRKAELLKISENCNRVPENGATSFYEACQSFWFVQQLIQLESSGHSISPGRFDQYMYPYYKADMEAGRLTRDQAQEYIDCIWVKLNDLNKCRDAESAKGFAGYSLFQNLIVGGQDRDGRDVTNDLSFMCIWASHHVFLPMPSLSIRVWNLSPQELLVEAARLTRTGIGLPAYYNDEVIIPSMMNRGISLQDAREYNIIGCVEPSVMGKMMGWHDAAFFNMCRPLEFVFSNGCDKGEQVSVKTGELSELKTFEDFWNAYEKQMEYQIELLVNADNAIDQAHAVRVPLPWLSCMVDDCMERGLTTEQGGAVYNFTGPQGFGIANVSDALYAIKTLVYDEHKLTLEEYKRAMALNFGQGFDDITVQEMTMQIAEGIQKTGRKLSEADIEQIIKDVRDSGIVSGEEKERLSQIREWIDEVPKYGNDIPEVDDFAREVAYLYTRPLEKYRNPRGGQFQAGLYPVSANVPLGAQTGATPDGRLAHTPIADGVGPAQGRDTKGPTATANSVSRLDHGIASNGTLFNQKFHPSALAGESGLNDFVALIRTFFDEKGMHMQFNVVDKQTLLDAQKNPDKYRHLVVRVAGYSALFTTLSKSLQDDIIQRTEQGLEA
ncbi:MAG: glycyl radical protein [Lachnospiraceae bacterium]|nr:glycyl radical protein [Lachnospiraceae bacterium]